MKRLLVALFAILALSLLLISPPQGQAQIGDSDAAAHAKSEAEVAEALAVAKRLESLDFQKEALARLEDELSRNSASKTLLKALAHRYLKGSKFDPKRALELYVVASNIDRNDIEALVGRTESAAAIAATLANYDSVEGRAKFREAVEITRSEAKALIAKSEDTNARAHSILGELDRRDALELRDDSADFVAMRRALLESARAHYERALALKLDDPISERALVDTLIELGEYSEATRYLDSIRLVSVAREDFYLRETFEELRAKLALAKNPMDLATLADAWGKLAGFSPSEHNTLSAEIAKRAAAYTNYEDGKRVVLAWKEYWRVQASLAKSIEVLSSFVPGDDPKGDAGKLIVPEYCFISALAWIEYFDSAQPPFGEDPSPELLRQREIFLGRAERLAKAALPCADKIHNVYEALAHIALEKGDFAVAKAHFKTMATLDPDNAEFANLAYFCDDMEAKLLSLGDYRIFMQIRRAQITNSKRIGLLEGLLHQAPNFPDALAFLGRLQYEAGSPEKAAPLFKQALEHRAENTAWLSTLAMCYLRLEKWDESYDTLKKLNAIEPNEFTQTWLELLERVTLTKTLAGAALANYQISANQSLSASDRARYLMEALKLSPNFAEASVELSSISRELGENSVSLEYARDGVKNATRDATKASALTSLAATLFAIEAYPEAAKAYSDALALLAPDDPLRAQLIDFKAKCALVIGNHDEAARLQEEAIRLSLDQDASGLSRFRPHRDALSQMPDKRELASGVRTRLSMLLPRGATISLVGNYANSVEGNGQDATTSAKVKLAIEVLETPSSNTNWRVGLTIVDAPVSQAILQRRAVLTISPIFGLLEEAWEAGVGANTGEPTLADTNSAALYMNAVVELFSLGLGSVEITSPFVWRNQESAGVLHLVDGAEASYLAAKSDTAVHLHRIAIADYRSQSLQVQVWAPRRRIDAEAVLTFPELQPKELRLKMLANEVIRDKEEQAIDVKVTRFELHLRVE